MNFWRKTALERPHQIAICPQQSLIQYPSELKRFFFIFRINCGGEWIRVNTLHWSVIKSHQMESHQFKVTRPRELESNGNLAKYQFHMQKQSSTTIVCLWRTFHYFAHEAGESKGEKHSMHTAYAYSFTHTAHTPRNCGSIGVFSENKYFICSALKIKSETYQPEAHLYLDWGTRTARKHRAKNKRKKIY